MKIKRAARIVGSVGITAILLALPACDTVGNPLEAISGKIPPPDEFQVLNHKPLMMPQTASLPVPRPGEASPLAPDPHRAAKLALLGSGTTVASPASPSAGEQVLLASANAASSSSEIRVQLEQDKIENNTNKPYKPPSLFERLGFGGEKLDESTLLDPAAEAQRLQSEGKVTPVDPNATVEVDEVRPPLVDSQYLSKRPTSPFTDKVPTY
ncbi:MAG TPA: DUF3035 domain-containing protein [Thermohalobaculum sp.]|nr:DUF3035 domain-containing protein [Thermohalobaculum sp.]